jgi:hypothetical protein
MADTQPPQPNRGWRNEPTRPRDAAASKPAWQQAAAPAAGAPAGKRPWQQGPEANAAGPRRLSRRAKFGLAAAAFLALVGGIAYLIYLIRPTRPPQLVLPVADNAANLAVAADPAGKRAGKQAREDLAGVLREQNIEVQEDELSPDGLDKLLQGSKGHFSKKGAEKVVLFVAAHGGADRHGAYLVPEGADPSNPQSRVRLGEVLKQLGSLDAKTQKLLILDATQVPASWPLGILHNDFARELKKLEPEINQVPRLVVLSASDQDQRSWVCEEWGTTVFAHYVIEGLKGAAPAPNGRITPETLAKYVQKGVEEWVLNNRNAVQKPVLLGDRSTAAAMELQPANSSYQPPALQKPPDLPAALFTAWQAAEELGGHSPPPEVVAPHLWRRYLETLLRYEQLLRAGDGSAAAVQGDLVKLQGEIIRAQRLTRELRSAQNTAALPTALSPPAEAKKFADEVRKALGDLWRGAGPEEYRATWDRLQRARANDRRALQALRVRLAGLLVRQAAEDPEKNLATACDIQKVIDDLDPQSPRPAEAQFMVLLRRDLANPPDWKLVQKALRARVLAEEAAVGLRAADAEGSGLPAFSEQVYPWVKQTVEKADAERRRGEDRVLASAQSDWQAAAKHLDEAEKGYQQAQADAAQVRKALQVRAEVLTRLPYYSQWLARRDDTGPNHKVYQLWREVHALDRLLEERPQGQPRIDALKEKVKLEGRDPRPGTLGDRAEAIQTTFNEIRKEFDALCQGLRQQAFSQRRWHDTEDALLVPFIAPGVREELLKNSRAIAYELHAQPPKEAGGQGAMTAADNARRARAAAQRQARMALAVLGEEWFDIVSERSREGLRFARASELADGPGTEEWWGPLTQVGDQVAQRWARLLGEVSEQTKAGREAPDLGAARARLREAARWARHLDGAAASLLGQADPVEENRRVELHDLLCWQAERTFRDHWWSEEGPVPYYRSAGNVYLADARGLAGRTDLELTKGQLAKRLGRVAEVQKQLDAPGKVTAAWSDGADFRSGKEVLNLTDEDHFERVYRIEAGEGVLEGSPVVWVESGKPLQARDGRRQVLADLGSQRRVKKTYEVDVESHKGRSRLAPEQAEYHLRGRFRGQKFDVDTTVHIYREADVVAYQHRPTGTGGVAVQSPRENNAIPAGDIAVVLDCSGSMSSKDAEGKKRIQRALDALEEVLARLPAGARLSVRVFSHRGFENRSELVRPLRAWAPGQAKDLMDDLRLRATPTDGPTPLVKTMVEARGDLGGAGRSRTMVVITDGGNYDGETPPEKIPGILRKEFRASGIFICAIGFELSFEREEERQAAKEFKEAVPAIGGKYVDAKNSRELVDQLRRAILPRFWLERNSDGVRPPQMPEDGQDVSRTVANPHWVRGLPPDVYALEARAEGGSQLFTRRIRIRGGEYLLLNVLPGLGGGGFERALYSNYYRQPGLESGAVLEDGRSPARAEKGGWLLDVLRNRWDEGDLDLRATLEKTSDRRREGGYLEQARPSLAWYQVKLRGGKDAALTLQFGALPGYPAPAWGLTVRDWPRSTAPTLEAWCCDKDFAQPEADHPFAGLLRRDNGDFRLGMDPHPVPAKLKGNELADVVIESLRVERRKVKTAPNPEEKVSCLVVRLRYPKGQPFLVHVPGSAGYEHRFYSEAGKYTGVFYDWTEERVEKDLPNLSLVSLEGFKAFCEKAGCHATLDLAKPGRGRGPTPPGGQE